MDGRDELSTAAPAPRVSVVIAAYNAEPWIGEAVGSVLVQTRRDFELVVVDDASTDATADVVGRERDHRLRLVRHPRNLGQARTWNHAVSLCSAPFVKFLCADDFLRPDCLEQMLAVAEASSTVGLVFSRRSVAVSPQDTLGLAWRETYERSHESFGPLRAVNSGRHLFDVLAELEFPDNWIGEPSNVMLRRDLFDLLGGFHPEIRQPVDFELWLRAMFHSDVGFVDAELATYRVLPNSVTRATESEGSRWLDRLWLLESLLADEEIRAAHPELVLMVRREWLHAAGGLGRSLVSGTRALQRLGEARRYVAYKLRNDYKLRGESPTGTAAS